MKVGIIGSGDVGQALGRGLARHGHEVLLGTRDPKAEKVLAWAAAAGHGARVGTMAEAAAFGEVVILAVLGSAAESAIALATPANLAHKVLLDATNPLDFSKGMPPGLFVGTTDSLAERIQRGAPSAKVVKCFNTVGNSQMIDPSVDMGVPRMFIAGDDAEAKATTTRLLQGLGWAGTIDMGGIEAARWLEASVPLWVRVGVALGSWDHIFTVARPADG